ncbi:MAG: DinB family protein [Acidobacteria bacterium]|nr:DinB family protein [Acidobacteriota bacterium]
MPPASLLDEALEAWGDARRGVIAELRSVPPGQIDFRPERGARSVAEIAQHVVDTGLMWCGELSNPDGDFTRMSFMEFMEAHGTPASKRPDDRSGLVRLLRSTHAAGARRLRRVGEVGILQTIRRFDGETGTRLAWLQHGIAHEEYHRGQLALYVRLLGRTPALTRLIEGS